MSKKSNQQSTKDNILAVLGFLLALTAGLGAAAGFVLLWWVLFSCWIKSLIQAEFSRYILVSGDTYIRAINRLPGNIPGPNGSRLSIPFLISLIAIIPATMGNIRLRRVRSMSPTPGSTPIAPVARAAAFCWKWISNRLNESISR